MTNFVAHKTSARATPGTVTHDGRRMRFAHGTPGGYVRDECRCRDCALASAWRDVADVTPILAELKRLDVSDQTIGAHLGVSDQTVRGWRGVRVARVRAIHVEALATLLHRARQGALAPPPLAAVPDLEPDDGGRAADYAAARALADELRRLRAASTWRADAACLGMPPSTFFPSHNGRTRRPSDPVYLGALAVCRRCPVLEQCRRDHAGEVDGVWFGTTPEQRAADRRAAGGDPCSYPPGRRPVVPRGCECATCVRTVAAYMAVYRGRTVAS